MSRIGKEWGDCDFSGIIKVYDLEPKAPQEPVENLDDYDVRHGFGGKVRFVSSRFNREEM